MLVVGIDLAGKHKNPTGFCALWTPSKEVPLGKTETKILYTDEEILDEIERLKPDCIAIDAPFWIPKTGPWRPSEKLLIKRGFRILSPLLPTMQTLALRASGLVRKLREKGYRVIEVFPRATEKILGVSKEKRKNEHEYDALLCALTGKYYLEGSYEDLDGIIVPK